MSKCQRCGKETNCTIMSMFNTQILCLDCKEKEEKHPEYKKAQKAELKHVKREDYNYKGIGKPNNL